MPKYSAHAGIGTVSLTEAEHAHEIKRLSAWAPVRARRPCVLRVRAISEHGPGEAAVAAHTVVIEGSVAEAVTELVAEVPILCR